MRKVVEESVRLDACLECDEIPFRFVKLVPVGLASSPNNASLADEISIYMKQKLCERLLNGGRSIVRRTVFNSLGNLDAAGEQCS